ncbi:NACHT domain-containing protein [Mycena vulgaris]|nr:NACHT domain-containing protein [Mycena vulgaris]
MPIITNSSGFQIHSGNFYEVSGDVNLETHQHLTMRQERRLLDADISASGRPLTRASHPQDNPRSSLRRPPSSSGPECPDQRPDSLGSETHSDGRLVDPPRLIHGGTFISAENINHHNREDGIQILHRAVILDALYNSAESFPQPRCHPKTRKAMLDSLYNWAIADTSTHSISWLHGPAGAGKSAIMQSLCHRLQQAGRLGGSFFFKRGHLTRGSARALFATLAYQLALSNRHLKPLISGVVENDPSVVARHMDIQLHQLIVEPCQSLDGGASPILLIDGLDECEGNLAQQEMLRLLGDIVAHHHPLRLRLLVASRPESHIREKFDTFQGLYDSVKIDQSFTDVRNYLRIEFDRIHREHHETMASVPSPWPPWGVIENLVDTSSGYFIYAATVIKFIDDRDFRPTERLAAVVENLPAECGTLPFHPLDKLYLQILRDVPFQSRIITILCVIVHGSNLRLSRVNIEKLLGLDPGDLARALRRLHSLLLVPPNGDEISLHHKSFRDFLLDPDRSGKFYLGLERRKELARSVLRALSQSSALISSHVAWSIGSYGLNFITSGIPPSADLSSLLQTVLGPAFLSTSTMFCNGSRDFPSHRST